MKAIELVNIDTPVPFKGLACSTCCYFTVNYCDKWDEPMNATDKPCGEFL